MGDGVSKRNGTGKAADHLTGQIGLMDGKTGGWNFGNVIKWEKIIKFRRLWRIISTCDMKGLITQNNIIDGFSGIRNIKNKF